MENPKILEYNDGIKKIFLYTDGEIGGSRALKNLLRYIRDTCVENAVDSDLQTLHSGIERLKNSREIGVRYMLELEKAKEKLRNMIDEVEQEVTERVTEEVTERVTEEVTERVTEEVTERVTEEVKEMGVKVLIETCQDFGASKEAVRTRIMEKYGTDLKSAEEYIAKYWRNPY